VIDAASYDWEGDRPLNRPMEDTIIYEMHVRGFTQSPSSQVRRPGTFGGIIEKIPYLKDLGVTAVELLPVFDFDETAVLAGGNGRWEGGERASRDQLLGVQHGRLLRASIGLLRESRDRQPLAGIPRYGQDPTSGWNRSHSGRGIQSHG